jgi:hypothetical protein
VINLKYTLCIGSLFRMDNFKPFGGWKKPTVKLYKWQFNVCGTFTDL